MRYFHTLSLAAVLLAGFTLTPGTARAGEDCSTNDCGTSAKFKGITGGALLGAEVVMLGEAAFKVKPAWAYAVGGIAGGVGGGLGGYFLVEKGCAEGDTCARVSMYMVAGGMALIIPTTVAVLSAAAYEPPADYTEDKGTTKEEPVAEPPQPGAAPGPTPQGQPPSPTAPAPAPEGKRSTKVHHRVAKAAPILRPPALFAMDPKDDVTLSVPAVEVRNVWSRTDLMQYGMKPATELRVPVVNVVF